MASKGDGKAPSAEPNRPIRTFTHNHNVLEHLKKRHLVTVQTQSAIETEISAQEIVGEIFPVLNLPRELRCKIWEEVVLHDDVSNLESDSVEQTFGEDYDFQRVAVRRSVPGYFRPCVLTKPLPTLFTRRYYQAQLLNRLPALFLVSKQVAAEVREVAFKHIMIELDHDKCCKLLQRLLLRIEEPMFNKTRNLYLFTNAKVLEPSGLSSLPFANSWPRLYFDHHHVPLFRIEVTSDGSGLALYAQRELGSSDKMRILDRITRWSKTLLHDHRFSRKDLLAVAIAVQEVQSAMYSHDWALQIDQQDVGAYKRAADAQEAEERRSGNRDWDDGWLPLEPEFRATIVNLVAPYVECLENAIKT